MQSHKTILLLLCFILISTNILLRAQGTSYVVKAKPDSGIVSGGVFIGLASQFNVTAATSAILLGGTRGSSGGAWKDLTGITQTGNTLTKTAPTEWGNAGAASCDKLNGMENGWISYQVSNLSNKIAFGLSNSNTNASFESIKYAVMLDAGQLAVYNNGQLMGNFGTLAINDSIHIERIANMLFYTKNKIVFFNQEVDVKQSLIIDVALYTKGTTFSVISSFSHTANCQDLNFTVPNTICAGLPVSFQNTSTACSDNPTFMRNYGDGSPPTDSPNHTFTSAGIFEVKLYIPSSANCSESSITKLVTVTNCKPPCASCENLQFYFPDKICVGEKVTFINAASGCSGNTNLVWDFGDGTSVSSLSSHTYTNVGTNTVKLFIPVADTCSEKSISKTITVAACSEFDCNPLVNNCDGFSASLSGPGAAEWAFTADVTGGAAPFQYSWALSTNLTISAGNNTNTIYTNIPPFGSSYTVAVTITDSNNCTITKSIVFAGF